MSQLKSQHITQLASQAAGSPAGKTGVKPSGPADGRLSRRTLFAGAGTVGAVAAAASLIPSIQPAEQAAAPLKPPPANGGGYSLSEHVKRYYKTTLV